jgi:hypothetical protein
MFNPMIKVLNAIKDAYDRTAQLLSARPCPTESEAVEEGLS